MLAAVALDSQLLLAVVAAVATGWGISRSGAVKGYKDLADARKERIAEIEAAQARAEETIVILNQKLTTLEAQPDLTEIREEVRARHAEMLGCWRDVKEAVDEIAARWG